MTKADLVEQVYEAIGPGVTKKDCAAVVDAFLNAIKRALAEGSHIEIRGFGTFKVRQRRTRMARNPRTGDPVRVPARAVPVFKPSRLFKEDVADRQSEGPPGFRPQAPGFREGPPPGAPPQPPPRPDYDY